MIRSSTYEEGGVTSWALHDISCHAAENYVQPSYDACFWNGSMGVATSYAARVDEKCHVDLNAEPEKYADDKKPF